jgi:peptidoglycan/xylan/chitin deacetylase (PgdA/CDA1 family)
MRHTVAFAVSLLLAALAQDAARAASPVKHAMLITVDDLPISSARLHSDPGERERITKDLLDALRRHGIRAVGLVTWKNVRDDADRRLLDLWLEAGHELGNHSFGHLDLTREDPETWIADAERGREALAAYLAGRRLAPRFFRFPFLQEGDTEAKLDAARAWLARTGQRNLPVTIDDQDWAFEEPWVEARRARDRRAMDRLGEDFEVALRIAVNRQEKLGDELAGRTTPQILLLHATEVGAAQWDRLFTRLEEAGHRFVGADEVLADAAFSDPPRFLAAFGCGLWDRIAQVREADRARRDVEALLREQVGAWSRGDLEGFASAYDDDVMFVSPSGLTRGRRDVVERYRKRYPDTAAMGALALDVLDVRPTWGREVTPLGDGVPGRIHGVVVVARWTLSYPDRAAATGLTLLVLERRREGYRIVRDASM